MADAPLDGLRIDDDGRPRCWWYGGHDDYRTYHDDEWGRPVAEDRRLFEKLCLEGFQSGLSWLTILRKRESFRAGFANFDAAKVARFGPDDVARLLGDAGIVRHRGKIESTINNAGRFLDLVEEFGSLAAYVWHYEPSPADRPTSFDYAALTSFTTSPGSVAMSKDLRKRGWSFVGPTTVYAFMQAMGLVNDHLDGCMVRAEALADRARFAVPGGSTRPGRG